MRKLIPTLFLAMILCNPAGVFSAEGDLDRFFGQGGVVTFNRGVNDAAQAVALQSDGKIVIAGTVSNGSNTDVLLMRRTADGRRDTSFGVNGFVTFDSGNDDAAHGVAVQPDGKILVVGQTSNGTNKDILVLRWNSNGVPDATFHAIGAATFDLGDDETASAVAVQTNTRIVIAGTASNGTDNDFLVMRLDSNGVFDSTFNAVGFLTIDRGGNDTGRAVAVQANGLIVATGTSSNGSNSDLMVVRLTADGSQDISFNLNGIVTIDRGGRDVGNAVAVQPNGLIVVAGESSNGSDADLFVVRLTAGGIPDVSFSINGIVTIDRGGKDSGNALGLQPNGKILVVGSSSAGTDQACITVRLNADGTRDTTFSLDGVAVFQGTSGGDDSGNAVAVQSDGKIVVAGEVSNGSNTDLLVLRYTPEGILDTSFNDDGIFTFSSKIRTTDAANGVALQRNGKIIIAGRTGSGADGDLLVLRYTTDGILDRKFSNDGIAVYSGEAGGEDRGRAVAVQEDGQIVVVGQTSNGANNDLLVLRYTAKGVLDSSFSSDGVAVYNGAADSDDIGRAVAVQEDGKIVVVGQTSNGISNSLLMLRYTSSGSLDATFGTDGVVKFGGSANASGRSVAIQPDGRIVVAAVHSNGSNTDLLVMRFTASGSLDASFGIGGTVTYDSGNTDVASAVALQPDGKIVVAGSSSNGSKNVAFLARFSAEGALDTTFSDNGIVRYNSGAAGDDSGNAVAVQSDNKIVVAGTANAVEVLLLRYREDGTLDTSFSGNGVVMYDGFADTADAGNAVALQPDGKIVVAGSSANDVLILRYVGQKVRVLTPHGGEVLEAGALLPFDITWTAPPKAVLFTIELSVDNGATWRTLAQNVTGSAWPWPVPLPAGNKRSCFIRVTGYDASKVKVSADISDNPFMIEVMRVAQPNGGEIYSVGDPVNITWITNNTKRAVDSVKLLYTLNGGRNWLQIPAAISGNPGSFAWTAPSVPKEKRRVKFKVVLKDDKGKTVGKDASDANFTIQP